MDKTIRLLLQMEEEEEGFTFPIDWLTQKNKDIRRIILSMQNGKVTWVNVTHCGSTTYQSFF